MSRVKVYTDGASRGNPGESGIGIIIYDESGTKLKSWNEFTGTKTNNQAEYLALLKAADLLNELKNDVKISFIEFYADSQLMVKQMNLEYKVKDPGLKELFLKAQKLVNHLRLPYKFIHIERALNKEADKLANQGIDNKNIQL